MTYKKSYKRGSHLLVVRYRPGRRGQSARIALVDLSRVVDVRSILEQALGPLALFEIVSRTSDKAQTLASTLKPSVKLFSVPGYVKVGLILGSGFAPPPTHANTA